MTIRPLAVGIFGNISMDDIYATVRALPGFCAPAATVLWSRGRRVPDVTGQIRATFGEAGFDEIRFHAPPDARFQIGVVRYQGPPQPPVRSHLFRFVK